MTVLEEFIKLYEVSPKINQLKPLDNVEYRAFVSKSGLPVGLTNTIKYLDHLPYATEFIKFYREFPNFWMIPCDTPSGQIYGFVFRSFHGKGFRECKNPDTAQMFFGFHMFKNFEYGNTIIVTEGVKDALFLQRIYPYTLAVLTSTISQSGLKIIKSLTNSIVISLDNDNTGQREAKKLRVKLIDIGVGVRGTIFPSKAKDFGDYFSIGVEGDNEARDILRTGGIL